MNAQVLTGSKKEIAESVARIPGEVREAIVFIEEPSRRDGGISRRDFCLDGTIRGTCRRRGLLA